ncbi:MAG: hypothetical protein QNJ64_03600 [Crocosphaera sp.]|nr:hypothetical protein [Crocosphaera sp.]
MVNIGRKSKAADNCKKRVRNSQSPSECKTHSRQQIPGKKGCPRFKKNTRSVEYKTSGWKL